MMLSEEEILSWTVNDLKAELKKRGEPTAGKKAELQDRLRRSILSADKLGGSPNKEEKTTEVVDIDVHVTAQSELESNGSATNVPIDQPNEEITTTVVNTESNNLEKGDAASTSSVVDDSIGSSTKATALDITDLAEVPVDYEEHEDSPHNADTVSKEVELSESSTEIIAQNSVEGKDIETTVSQDDNVAVDVANIGRFVRIDNFQRPFILKGLYLWLKETCQFDIPIENVWLNPIKTHCYVDFASHEEALKCISAVQGKRFPETSKNPLVADFTSISAFDAPNSDEARLKPGEWKNFKPVSNGNYDNHDNQETVEVSVGKKRKAFDFQAPGLGNMFKRVAMTTLQSSSSAGTKAAPLVMKDGSINSNRDITSPRNKPIPKGIDPDLRFTTTKPRLSWKPVSEEVANSRRMKFRSIST